MQEIFANLPLEVQIGVLLFIGFFLVLLVYQKVEMQLKPFKVSWGRSKNLNNDSGQTIQSQDVAPNDIEGVWGDWFKNGNEFRAAIINIKHTPNGYCVTGFEYNELTEEVASWSSDVCIYRRSTGKFKYLFEAEERVGKLRKFRGFTCLRFMPIESPEEYRGYFVDVYDTDDPDKKETRSDPLKGKKLDLVINTKAPFSEESRKFYATKLIQEGKLAQGNL